MASRIEGVITLTIKSARDLPSLIQPEGDDPYFIALSSRTDVHVNMHIGKKELTRTQRVGGAKVPSWQHTYKFYCKGKFLPGTAFDFHAYEDDLPNLANIKALSHFLGTAHLPIEKIVTEQKGSATLDVHVDLRKNKGMIDVDFEYTPTDIIPSDLPVVEVDNVQNDVVSGIIRVSIQKAEDLKKPEFFGTCDPYVKVIVPGAVGKVVVPGIPPASEDIELTRTPIVKNNPNPTWDFKDEVFISGVFLDDTPLEFHAFDDDLITSEKLGLCSVPIYDLFTKKKIQEKKPLQIPGEKPKGELTFELTFEATIKCPANVKKVDVGDLFYQKWIKEGCPEGDPAVGSGAAAKSEYDNPRVRGILTSLIEGANLGGLKKSANTYASLTLAQRPLNTTPVINDSLQPLWNHKSSVVLEGTFFSETKVVFSLFSKSTGVLANDECLGTWSAPVYEFLKNEKWKQALELVGADGKPTGITLTVACAYKKLKKNEFASAVVPVIELGDEVYEKWRKAGGKL